MQPVSQQKPARPSHAPPPGPAASPPAQPHARRQSRPQASARQTRAFRKRLTSCHPLETTVSEENLTSRPTGGFSRLVPTRQQREALENGTKCYHSPFLISFFILRITRSRFNRLSRSINKIPSR